MRTATTARGHRMAFLTLLAIPIGAVGAVAAAFLVALIGALTNALLFHRIGIHPPPMSTLHPGLWLVPTAALGGLFVSLLAKWVPVIRGHGIPEAMEVVIQHQSRIPPTAAVAKPLSAAVAIGTGGPFGAEGPIVVTGSAIGSLIGQVLPVSPAERRVLLACGAAAGTAGIFGTPMAAVLLPLELLVFEFSTRSLVPMIVASAVATAIRQMFVHGEPFLPPVTFAAPSVSDLLAFAALGLLCGFGAIVICKGLFLVEAGYRRLPVSAFWHPVIGGIGFALVGLVAPRALGVGYDVIGAELAGTIVGATLAALTAAKLLAWWVALGSGTSGGTLAPLLFIGGGLGGTIAWLADKVGIHADPRAYALIGMAAVFGASTRAVLTGVVFMVEISAAPNMAVPLLLATALAAVVATTWASDSLMTEKLSRRGLRIHHHAEVDILRHTLASQMMTRDVVALAASMTAADARAVVANGGHGAFPVVSDRDSGRLEGIVSRTDLLADDVPGDASVLGLASLDVVTVAPDASALDVLETIVREDVEHVPVLDRGRLVGMCTRTDVLRARAAQLLNEEVPRRVGRSTS